MVDARLLCYLHSWGPTCASSATYSRSVLSQDERWNSESCSSKQQRRMEEFHYQTPTLNPTSLSISPLPTKLNINVPGHHVFPHPTTTCPAWSSASTLNTCSPTSSFNLSTTFTCQILLFSGLSSLHTILPFLSPLQGASSNPLLYRNCYWRSTDKGIPWNMESPTPLWDDWKFHRHLNLENAEYFICFLRVTQCTLVYQRLWEILWLRNCSNGHSSLCQALEDTLRCGLTTRILEYKHAEGRKEETKGGVDESHHQPISTQYLMGVSRRDDVGLDWFRHILQVPHGLSQLPKQLWSYLWSHSAVCNNRESLFQNQSDCPHVTQWPTEFQRGTWYKNWWSTLKRHDPPKSIVYPGVHCWCCTFYGSWQMYSDVYLSLWFKSLIVFIALKSSLLSLFILPFSPPIPWCD